MKLSKSPYQEDDPFDLEVEPGERFDIWFNPDGANAVSGGDNVERAFSFRGRTLPNGDLALTVDFNEAALYKETPLNTGPAWLVVWRDHSPSRAEFELDQERPWDRLVLEKVDLQALLKPAPEERCDG